MATPMRVYGEIAARYGVDPHDREAMDRFFIEQAVTLPDAERVRIVTELLDRDGEAEEPDLPATTQPSRETSVS